MKTYTVTTTSATTSGNVTISRVADGYDTQEGQRFRFTLFGNQIIGTNFTERLQVYSADGSSSFKNLSDSAPIAASRWSASSDGRQCQAP